MMCVFVLFIHNTPAGDLSMDNVYKEEDIMMNEEISTMENNIACRDSEEKYYSSQSQPWTKNRFVKFCKMMVSTLAAFQNLMMHSCLL